MKDRLLLSFIISCFILNIVDGYQYKTKLEDIILKKRDNSWHHSREGNSRNSDGYSSSNSLSQESSDDDDDNDDQEWTGRWLPARAGEPTPPPKVFHKTGTFKYPISQSHSDHLVGMGVQSDGCDDGESNLRVDWDLSPINFTCYDKKIVPNYSTMPIVYCEHIPSYYHAIHKCMKHTIEYDDDIPIYGTHRPVWPVYGEYKFIPRQRWIHSLEHGAIVMLYHPCANPLEVKKLKKLVTGCLRRHVITPYTLLDEERPLALVSWGCRLTMSYVNPSVVKEFITTKALRGKEEVSISGGFEEFLIRESKTVTDEDDTTLCPGM